MRNRFPSEFYIHNILKGDRIVLSKAITIIESNLFSDEQLADEILKGILPFSGNSLRVGITGSPGVGKSTFIEAFGKTLLKDNKKIAVLSIDPTSSLTRGSILGDKTRMPDLSRNPAVFIRPSPQGNTLGGVASKTREVMLLCEAAGFDLIIIETVGVGQTELVVKSFVDFFLLLVLPGGGDELQGIKKGVVEMADLIAVTKADGENVERAKATRHEYQSALGVLHRGTSLIPQVIECSAVTDLNLSQIWSEIQTFIKAALKNRKFYENRKNQTVQWMHSYIQFQLQHFFYNHPTIQASLLAIEEEVFLGNIEPSAAAKQILNNFFKYVQSK